MRHRIAMTDTVELATIMEQDTARAITSAMTGTATDTKEAWRAQVEGAGLGQRLGRTIQAKVYPQARDSFDPAAWIFSKAPALMDAYDRGPTIVPVAGSRCLAIPTLNVPKRGRRFLTPVEVEALYDQDLTIRVGRRGTLLAFVDTQRAVASWTRNQGKAYGKASQKSYDPRPRRTGRPVWKLMFVLVRSVKVQKRLHIDALADYAARRYVDRLAQEWAALPDRSAPLKRL